MNDTNCHSIRCSRRLARVLATYETDDTLARISHREVCRHRRRVGLGCVAINRKRCAVRV